MKFYKLEPEVGGELGKNTVLDRSTFPPTAMKLHFEFAGWFGDCIVESFPCYLITNDMAQQLSDEGITGFVIRDVEITTSDEFQEMSPVKELPDFKWLDVDGEFLKDDLSISPSNLIVVSQKVLSLFKEAGLKNCGIEEFQNNEKLSAQIGSPIDRSAPVETVNYGGDINLWKKKPWWKFWS